MTNLTRRSVLRSSLALGAAGVLAQPHIVNAAATTAEVWFAQGFVPEEDSAFLAMVADYEKASGNKIDQSTIPYAALRQKAVSAITSGVVPDMIEVADFYLGPLQAWDDKLVDLSEVVEPAKEQFISSALPFCYFDTNVEKKRAYYVLPMKIAAVPFHIWTSLVEKGGSKIADLPKTWDAFLDFFMPVQDGLRAKRMRNIYAYGYQLTATGVDPENTFNAFMIAYGGKDFITPDGKLHTDDPQVKDACVKALMVMDFDGTISTEVALYHKKDEYDDILTHGMPLSNDGKELPSQISLFGPVIPKGAKNIPVAKELAKYMIQPKVLNDYLKAGLGRWALPIPEIVKSDPFWLKEDVHRTAYTTQSVLSATVPIYEAYNPAIAEVGAEHVFMVAAFDVMNNGMAPEAAIDKAFKRTEEIFAKYPIVSS
jgi:multiple sugar transport system substrate-binding protein